MLIVFSNKFKDFYKATNNRFIKLLVSLEVFFFVKIFPKHFYLVDFELLALTNLFFFIRNGALLFRSSAILSYSGLYQLIKVHSFSNLAIGSFRFCIFSKTRC